MCKQVGPCAGDRAVKSHLVLAPCQGPQADRPHACSRHGRVRRRWGTACCASCAGCPALSGWSRPWCALALQPDLLPAPLPSPIPNSRPLSLSLHLSVCAWVTYHQFHFVWQTDTYNQPHDRHPLHGMCLQGMSQNMQRAWEPGLAFCLLGLCSSPLLQHGPKLSNPLLTQEQKDLADA